MKIYSSSNLHNYSKRHVLLSRCYINREGTKMVPPQTWAHTGGFLLKSVRGLRTRQRVTALFLFVVLSVGGVFALPATSVLALEACNLAASRLPGPVSDPPGAESPARDALMHGNS